MIDESLIVSVNKLDYLLNGTRAKYLTADWCTIVPLGWLLMFQKKLEIKKKKKQNGTKIHHHLLHSIGQMGILVVVELKIKL